MFIMFTKHLQEHLLPTLVDPLRSAGMHGADLCVRPGSTIDATWLFDPHSGVIVSVTATDKLSIRAKVSTGDQVVGVLTLSAIINQKNTLTEFSGAPVGPRWQRPAAESAGTALS
jgi:hypothetical protein